MQVEDAISQKEILLPAATPHAIGRVTKRIGVLVFEGFPVEEVSLLADVFRLANDAHIAQTGLDASYSLVMLSETGGSISSGCGLRVWTDSLDGPLLNGFDTLFIAGGPGAARTKCNDRLIRKLRSIAPKIRLVKALGEGRAVLAALDLSFRYGSASVGSGGLRHRRALTEPELDPVIDAASAAFIAALKAIKHDHGAAMAQLISERALPGIWRRLAPMLDDGEIEAVNGKINTAARWLRENYHRQISVTEAAHVAQMSERNFVRRFKTQTGLTPSEYLLRARLDASCLLLSQTDLPIDTIARRCGIQRGDGLAKIFRRRLSISPSDYRAANRPGARHGG